MTPLWVSLALAVAVMSSVTPPVRGTLHGRYSYVTGLRKLDHDPHWLSGAGSLAVLRIALDPREDVLIIHQFYGAISTQTSMLRWQIVGDRFHLVSRRTGSNDFDFPLSSTIGSVALPALEAAQGAGPDAADHSRRIKISVNTADYWPFLGTKLSPYAFELSRHRSKVTYDLWIRGRKEWEVYLAEPSRGNLLSREDFHSERDNGSKNDRNPLWETAAEWTFDWTGSFYVVAVGDERFFVTDAGRLYHAPRAAKPRTPLREIKVPGRIDAIIHDSDARKWYAFTASRYFEVGELIQPKPHAIAIRRAWFAMDALATSAECGHVIRNPRPPRMDERTWDDLASPNLRTRHVAAWAMMSEPAKAVVLIEERLSPVPSPSRDEVAVLVAKLGAESFADRETAEKRLREFGHAIRPMLREMEESVTSAEARRRLGQLLADLNRPEHLTSDERRARQAVLVLDRISSPDAKALLKEYATGTEHAILTREARKALR